MKVTYRSQFSEHPDLVVIFVNTVRQVSEAGGIITGIERGGKGKKSKGKLRVKGGSGTGQGQIEVYSGDVFFYNEIIGYVRKGFFGGEEGAIFSLYEQGKYREVLYVRLPIYGERGLGGVGGRGSRGGDEEVKQLGPGEFLDKVRHRAADLMSSARRGRKWEVDVSMVTGMVGILGLSESDFIEAWIEGLILGGYTFSYSGEKEGKGEVDISLVGSSLGREAFSRVVLAGVSSGEAACFARDLGNAAPNKLTIGTFARQAEHVAQRSKLRFTELNYSKLVKEGLGGLIAVNSGSRERAKLLLLEYSPKRAEKTILLVGKGVLFDSGGLSIKPTAGMVEMKMDMAGAGLVLAVMSVLRRLAVGARVVAALPLTDNMISAESFRVGDVIKLYNGKHVEVLNTDAEGRLILADALSYAIKKYRPDYTLDFATLTGACVVALGHYYAGLWSNDEDLAGMLVRAGEEVNELLWRMPLHAEYLTELKSKVADLKNVGGMYGGANTAAKFLEQFVGTAKWAHVDIASTMSYQQDGGYKKKGASGYGVRLLLRFLSSLT